MAKKTKAQREQERIDKLAREQADKVYALPENVRQAIGQYLMTRPMGEVRMLVEALEQLPTVEITEEKEVEKV